MRNISSLFTKIAVTGALAFSLVGIGFMGTAQARTEYTSGGTATSTTPVFNEFYNVPNGVGDEADFVRVKPKAGTNADYTSTLKAACKVGDLYTVRTYVHNGADPSYNNDGAGTAVAKNVTVKMTAPLNTADDAFTFKSVISASNAASVTDTGALNCGDKTVKLSMVAGSVQTYSKPIGFKTVTDTAVNGTLRIGSRDQGSGDVWGCWDDRVIVTYDVKIVEVPKPVVSTAICKALDVNVISGRTVNAKVTGEVKNATITGYEINFGDGKKVTEQTAEYTYAKDGTYTVTGRVQAKLANGDLVWKTDDNCTKKVTFEAEQPTKVTPEVPPTMPKTGAAGLVALFSGVTAAGAVGHRLFTTRRFNK